MRIGLVHTASLFTRGPESVRIVRVSQATGEQRLLVNGPGSEAVVHELNDAMECARHESELERRLVAKGFRLEHYASGSRRRGTDRRAHVRSVADRCDYQLKRVV
jgi:hypothetical protein